jgi:DNA repair protein RadA/Sms
MPIDTHVCRYCRARNSEWTSRCPVCGVRGAMHPAGVRPGRAATPAPTDDALAAPDGLYSLGTVKASKVERLTTGIFQVDRMMGDGVEQFGIARPSVIQFGGQPGIGKSTLLLQIANGLGPRCLYLTSEETMESIAARASRLQLTNTATVGIRATTSYEEARAILMTVDRPLAIIDSLQGLRMRDEHGKPMKHTQHTVRDIAMGLIQAANATKKTVFVVGHVNKQGDLAGLKEIEHMVDTVLWFRGVRSGTDRHMACEKNRFGDVSLCANFKMTNRGLVDREPDAEKKPLDAKHKDRPVADAGMAAPLRPEAIEPRRGLASGKVRPRRSLFDP